MIKKNWTRMAFIKKNILNWLPGNIKAVTIAIITSMIIGVIFGMISLRMAAQDKASGDMESLPVQEENDQQNSVTSFEDISFYVVQAGVFTDSENADKTASQFLKEGLPILKWNKGEQIYLFTGIHTSEEGAKDIASGTDLEVFVKEWQVNSKAPKLSGKDEEYVQRFISTWETSLEKGEINTEQWGILREGEISEKLLPLKEKINSLMSNEDIKQQQFLLETIYAYENIL